MTERKWSKAVTIALEKPEEWVIIDTTQAASWALIEDWPIEEAPRWTGRCPSVPM